jgi:hypothetical protein
MFELFSGADVQDILKEHIPTLVDFINELFKQD